MATANSGVKPAKIKLSEIILQINDLIGHRKSVYCKIVPEGKLIFVFKIWRIKSKTSK